MGHVPAIVVYVSPERMLGLIQRDQQITDMGAVIIIYGIGSGLRGDDLLVESCPDELCYEVLKYYRALGDDVIRILGEEPSKYPEMLPRNLVRAQYGQSPNHPHYQRKGPVLLRKTNSGWRR